MVRPRSCGGIGHLDLRSKVSIPGGYWPVNILNCVAFTPSRFPKTSLTAVTSEVYTGTCNGPISSNCERCPTPFLLPDVLSSLSFEDTIPSGFLLPFHLTVPSQDHLLVPPHSPNPEWSGDVSESSLPDLTTSVDSFHAVASNIIYMLMMLKLLHLICTSPWNPDAFNYLLTNSTWMSNRRFWMC